MSDDKKSDTIKTCANCKRYPACSVWSTGDLVEPGKPIPERKPPNLHPACGLWELKKTIRTTHVICKCGNIVYAEAVSSGEGRTVFVDICEKCNTNKADYDGVIGIAGFTVIDAVKYQARWPGTYNWRKLLDHLDKETMEEIIGHPEKERHKVAIGKEYRIHHEGNIIYDGCIPPDGHWGHFLKIEKYFPPQSSSSVYDFHGDTVGVCSCGEHLSNISTQFLDVSIRLNLGCGNQRLRGYWNIDIDPEMHLKGFSDETGSAICLFQYKDGTVEEIYASHLLDHLSRKNELDNTLHEWYRALKPGGILRVAVSDFEAISKLYRDGMDLESLWGSIVGGHKSDYDRHGCIFDFNVLRRYLEKHGFVNVKRYDWREFLPKGFEDNSCACIPKWDINGYPTSLNVVCMKVFLP